MLRKKNKIKGEILELEKAMDIIYVKFTSSLLYVPKMSFRKINDLPNLVCDKQTWDSILNFMMLICNRTP